MKEPENADESAMKTPYNHPHQKTSGQNFRNPPDGIPKIGRRVPALWGLPNFAARPVSTFKWTTNTRARTLARGHTKTHTSPSTSRLISTTATTTPAALARSGNAYADCAPHPLDLFVVCVWVGALREKDTPQDTRHASNSLPPGTQVSTTLLRRSRDPTAPNNRSRGG